MKINIKIQRTIAALLLLLCASCDQVKEDKATNNSIPKNQIDSLKIQSVDTLVIHEPAFSIAKPICFDYPDMGSFSPFDEGFYTFIKRRKNYFKGKKRLSEKFIRQQLFLNSDSIFIQDFRSGDTLNKIQIENYFSGQLFYLIDTVLKTSQFNGIIYEEINGHTEGSIKYLCTFNLQGRLISKYPIAFYLQTDFYRNEEDVRVPFYEEKKGCIEKDLTLSFITHDRFDRKYKIQNDGKIVEVK